MNTAEVGIHDEIGEFLSFMGEPNNDHIWISVTFINIYGLDLYRVIGLLRFP